MKVLWRSLCLSLLVVILAASCNGCSGDQFECISGRCIPGHYVCDGADDCYDGEDENNCARQGNCISYQFQCDDGRCIRGSYYCDGDDDCYDGSDEDDCTDQGSVALAVGLSIFFVMLFCVVTPILVCVLIYCCVAGPLQHMMGGRGTTIRNITSTTPAGSPTTVVTSNTVGGVKANDYQPVGHIQRPLQQYPPPQQHVASGYQPHPPPQQPVPGYQPQPPSQQMAAGYQPPPLVGSTQKTLPAEP